MSKLKYVNKGELNTLDAIKYLITIENETGYLVSGNLTVDTNNIQFSITTDNENISCIV